MIDRILSSLACGQGNCPCFASVRRGRGLTHCVSHDDPTPSLNVDPGTGDAVLVKCHGGCANADVIAALKERDLWPRPIVNSGVPFGERRLVAEYTYTDRDGQPVMVVERYQPKDFRQRAADGTRSLEGVTRVPYRLPKVLAAIARKERVFVCEGERDVETAEALGLVATTNPGGAGKWTDSLSECLLHASVVVLADKDEPGRAHARAVAQSASVGARDVRIIELPGRGKDLSDWVAEGGTRLALDVLVDDTPEWQSGEKVVYTAKDRAIEFREVMEKRRRGDPDEIGWRIGLGPLDREMVYSPGDVMLVAAATGTGKTSFLQSLERRATVPTLFFSVEMSRKQLMNRHLAAATGIDSWKIRRGALDGDEYATIMAELDRMEAGNEGDLVDNPALTTSALENILRVYCVRRGIKVVFVDHLQRLADKNSESERLRMAGIMRSLSRIARQTETQLVVACQVNRQGDRASGVPPYKSELAESGVLEQEASVILALGRVEGATETKLAVRKNRHGLDGFTVDLVFDLMHNNYLEKSEANLKKAEATGRASADSMEIPI